MARPQKNNADYFSHDCDMRNDPKIKALRKKYDHLGYSIYNMLLETLTREDFFEYELSEINIELLSGDFNIEPKLLTEIINYCILIKAFQINNNKLSSNGLKERLKRVIDKRTRAQAQYQQHEQDKSTVSVTETNPKEDNATVIDPLPAIPSQDEKIKKTVKEKITECDEREQTFYNDLRPYVQLFGAELIRKFYDYWRERNKQRTMMKKDYEKTWDIAGRLRTWQSNENKFSKGKNASNDLTKSTEEKLQEYAKLEARQRELLK